jgi:hypothetical protein
MATVQQPITGQSVTADELLRQFLSHAESALVSHGISLAPDGKTTLSALLSTGVDKMISENTLTPEDVGSAHQKVALLAEAIVLQARAKNIKVVTSSVFDKIKGFFCPDFPPFC